MTLTVLKSQIGEADYPAAVEQYRQALLDHRFTEGQPPPTAHNLVESAVKRVPQGDGEPDDFVTDYEIVDDTPPPPTMEERKAAAILESRLTEMKEIAKLIPEGRQRLAQMDFERAIRVPEKDRSPQQIELIRAKAELDDQIDQIRYEGAKREAEIEGMT